MEPKNLINHNMLAVVKYTRQMNVFYTAKVIAGVSASRERRAVLNLR
jgi:hypothetical protein